MNYHISQHLFVSDLDELFSNRREQLIMDIIKERNEIAQLRDVTGVTILHSASQYGLSKLMSFLLKENLVEINAVQKYNQTALHYAAFHNKPNCIKLLLQYKCDIDVKNHKGNRAIDVAKQYQNADASLLLQQAWVEFHILHIQYRGRFNVRLW